MLFDLRDVSLSRAGRRVLDGLTATIPEGISALVGPSGSGKSTVLRLLDRLADPDAGTVLYRGADVRDRDPLAHRREVGLVPQLPALLPGTVAENVAFAAGIAGTDPDLEGVLRAAGLAPDFADRPAGELSVGEKQRAMLARALAGEPRVLLLDEPTAALDASARDVVEEAIAGLSLARATSIVLVTHDPAQAERLAETVLRIEDGRAVAGP